MIIHCSKTSFSFPLLKKGKIKIFKMNPSFWATVLLIVLSSFIQLSVTENCTDNPFNLNLTVLEPFQINKTIPHLRILCSSSSPLEWTFRAHPNSLTLQWNTTYFRKSENVFEESQSSFESILTLVNITTKKILEINPKCVSVGTGSNCSTDSVLKLLNLTVDPQFAENGEKTGNCSDSNLDLWFDTNTHLFNCNSRKDNSSIPELKFKFCSNPTDCGLTTPTEKIEFCEKTKTGNICKDCHPKKINAGSEFPIPKVVTCSGKEKDEVKMMGFFHSIGKKGDPINSYVNWEFANPLDLLSIKSSTTNVLAKESLDFECEASYYYFAGGLHFTIKRVSEPIFAETEFRNFTNIKIGETLEYWNHTGTNIPYRRILLVEDLFLPSGDYEVGCYAPVWNSTAWTTTSLLVSVSNNSVPSFVTGNSSLTIAFEPRKNITCIAKGVPPPRITWIYREDKSTEKMLEVSGGSTSLSWSVLTLPGDLELDLEIKCHAENNAGWDEKLFVVTKNDGSFLVSTKLAALVVLLGFLANLLIFFFCWKKLFAEVEDEQDHERRRLAPVRFLRRLWNGQVTWAYIREKLTPSQAEGEDCGHPKCQSQTRRESENSNVATINVAY